MRARLHTNKVIADKIPKENTSFPGKQLKNVIPGHLFYVWPYKFTGIVCISQNICESCMCLISQQQTPNTRKTKT